MVYRPDWKSGAKKIYIDPNTRSRLPCLTVGEIRRHYPSNGFIIVGEIGGMAQPPKGGDLLLTDEGNAIPILAWGSVIAPLEWIAGYIPVGQNVYVAAVRSVVPGFLHRKLPSCV